MAVPLPTRVDEVPFCMVAFVEAIHAAVYHLTTVKECCGNIFPHRVLVLTTSSGCRLANVVAVVILLFIDRTPLLRVLNRLPLPNTACTAD